MFLFIYFLAFLVFLFVLKSYKTEYMFKKPLMLWDSDSVYSVRITVFWKQEASCLLTANILGEGECETTVEIKGCKIRLHWCKTLPNPPELSQPMK